MKLRIEWIDALKGFLLICICLSHFGFLLPFLRFLTYPTGSVWVPAFFFLSGLLYSSKNYLSFYDFLLSKTKSLLIPYLFFFFIFTLIDWNILFKTEEVLINNTQSLILGNGPEKAAPLWFIIRLFCANIIYYFLERNIHSAMFRMLTLIALFALSYYLHLNGLYFPLSLDVLFNALIFFGLAHISKTQLMKTILFLQKKPYYCLLSICTLIVFSLYASIQNPNAVMAQNKLYNLFFYFLTSICGTLAIIFLFSTLLIKLSSTKVFHILQYIARNGIIILATHCYCIFVFYVAVKFMSVENQWLGFLITASMMISVIYFIIVPLLNTKFYFFVGKNKLTFKQSLTI